MAVPCRALLGLERIHGHLGLPENERTRLGGLGDGRDGAIDILLDISVCKGYLGAALRPGRILLKREADFAVLHIQVLDPWLGGLDIESGLLDIGRESHFLDSLPGDVLEFALGELYRRAADSAFLLHGEFYDFLHAGGGEFNSGTAEESLVLGERNDELAVPVS